MNHLEKEYVRRVSPPIRIISFPLKGRQKQFEINLVIGLQVSYLRCSPDEVRKVPNTRVKLGKTPNMVPRDRG